MKKIKIIMILISYFHFLIFMIIWDLKFCIGDFGVLFLCPTVSSNIEHMSQLFTQNSGSSKDTPTVLGLIFLLLNF
jgi:type IV secretory pathway VirB6-like protein